MSDHPCCHNTSRPAKNKSNTRAVVATTKWIVPTAVLALLPKCPMCVAAYIALVSGFSVSLSVATWIRTGLLVACLCALTYLSAGTLLRALTAIAAHFRLL